MNPPPEVQAAMREWQAVTDDLVAIARACDPARLDAPSACGDWTNRQLLVHMATGYGVRIVALQSAVDGTPAAEVDADAANVRNIERLAAATVEQIIAEMMQVRGRVLVLLSRLTAKHLGRAISLGGGMPLRDALASLSQHDLGHVAELRS